MYRSSLKEVTETMNRVATNRSSDSRRAATLKRAMERSDSSDESDSVNDERHCEVTRKKKRSDGPATMAGRRCTSQVISSSPQSVVTVKPISKRVETLADLLPAAISQKMLAPMLNAPFLKSTISGCYALLPHKSFAFESKDYSIWKIVDLEEIDVVYEFNGRKTNKFMKCQKGFKEEWFALSDVSEDPLQPSDFANWLEISKLCGSVPTLDVIEKKRVDIQKAVDHKYLEDAVESMTKETRKCSLGPLNCVMSKVKYNQQKLLAAQSGDMEEVKRIQEKIDEIDALSLTHGRSVKTCDMGAQALERSVSSHKSDFTNDEKLGKVLYKKQNNSASAAMAGLQYASQVHPASPQSVVTVNPINKSVETLEDLLPAAITHKMLAPMLYAPFLKSTICGCYALLPHESFAFKSDDYSIWKIVDLEEFDVIYEFDGRKTNKFLKCQRGFEEDWFALCDVSEDSFQPSDFAAWLEISEMTGTVPTRDEVEEKKMDIQKAANHIYQEEEVELMIKETRKFSLGPLNCAMSKVKYIQQKELAARSGNLEEVKRIQEKIDEIDAISLERNSKRTRANSMIALIHQHRQYKREERMDDQVNNTDSENGMFIRRRGGLRLVTGTKSKGKENTLPDTMSANANPGTSKPREALQTAPITKSNNLSRYHQVDVDMDKNMLADISSKKSNN